MCVKRYMIASLRLRMTDPNISDSGASASSSLSVSDWIDTSNDKFGNMTVVIN